MKIEETVALAIAIQSGKRVLLLGDPGQGKSGLVRGGFTKLGFKVKVIRVNTTPPHYLSGFPVPQEGGQKVKIVPPDWVFELNGAERSIIFFDDITCAGQLAQTTVFGIMDEGMVADVPLKAGIVGAANLSTLATPRFELDAATANRLIHIEISNDPESFAAQARADFPAPIWPKLRGDIATFIPTHRERILTFLTSGDGAGLVNAMPKKMEAKTLAYPTQRSWQACWELMAACDAVDPTSIGNVNLRAVKRLLFIGAVGEAAHKTFGKHLTQSWDKPAADAIRQGKHYVFSKRGDDVFALCTAVSALLESNLSESNWNGAWGLVEALEKDNLLDRGISLVLDLIGLNRGKFALPGFYESRILPAITAPKKA